MMTRTLVFVVTFNGDLTMSSEMLCGSEPEMLRDSNQKCCGDPNQKCLGIRTKNIHGTRTRNARGIEPEMFGYFDSETVYF